MEEEDSSKVNDSSSGEEINKNMLTPEHASLQIHEDSELYKKLEEIPEALDYISKLLKILKKYSKKINKLRNKLASKAKSNSTNASTQTDEASQNNDLISFTEDIKQAAQTATRNMGFVYEETSGMYYDYNTGYYYNAEYGLYYDDKNRMYLQYNSETNKYEFHSSVAPVEVQKPQGKRKTRHKSKEAKRRHKDDNENKEERLIEEGECSISEESSSSENGSHSDNNCEIGRQWPPCMRVIVKSSENPRMKPGTLYILTCDGGTLGREGDHSILMLDTSASKHHLRFLFDRESNCYKAIDLGSRNGTLLNGKRMSPSKQESDPMAIKHGTEIKIGTTILICHVHSGSETCDDCEPGLLLQPNEGDDAKPVRSNKNQNYKDGLRKLKKIYGVNIQSESKLAEGYTDRAQKRRETVGSQNPHEKTQVASVNESIAKENKGFKLLAKMGWKEGQSLGKDGDGILEPIKSEGNVGFSGLGCDESAPQCVQSDEKQMRWKRAQKRFEKLPETFQDNL